jgi:hypothetical protein
MGQASPAQSNYVLVFSQILVFHKEISKELANK